MRHWWKNIRRKQFYKRLFERNRVKQVFDIGANDGVKSKLFLQTGVSVVAVEPMPDCVKQLKQLATRFPQLQVVDAAVSDSIGTGKLHIGSHSEISTLSDKMISEYTIPGKVGWSGEIKVKTTTLDSLFEAFGTPDFLKLDCEGHDHVILKTLNQPVQLIEFEFLERFKNEAVDSVEHLTSLASYTFNFSPYESGKWAFNEWKGSEEFCIWLLQNATVFIHGNIFAEKQVKR